MNDQLRSYLNEQATELDQSVHQVLEIAGGNVMAALRTVVIANIFLHEENEQLRARISKGFTRGRVKKTGG
jgi:regulator of replication initiation timing